MGKTIEELHRLIKPISNEMLDSLPNSEKSIFKNYKLIPIELLTPAIWNYKEEDEFMQSQLVNNIKRNGQIATCNVRALDTGYYEVVDGNHRLAAFIATGQRFVIVYDHGMISEAEAKRIAIEKNETRFDADSHKLSAIINELHSAFNNDELLLTMPYSESDITSMLAELDSLAESSMISDDEVENIERTAFNNEAIEEDEFFMEAPDEPQSQRGDLYELGNHRLLCGDSTDSKDVAKLMNGEKAHLLYTDPPYNVNYTEMNKNRNGDGKDWGEEYKSKWTDSMPENEFKDFLDKFISNAKSHLIEWAHYYVWHATPYFPLLCELFKKHEIPFDKTPILWIKQVAPISRTRYWKLYEPCIFGGKGAINGVGNGARWFGKIGEVNGWLIPREHSGHYIHPTQKPLPLAARAIHNSSQKGEIVLDLFLGSGSTLISSDIMGRACYGMEYEPKFADMIVLRYMKYCKDRNIECSVKLNGKAIDESHFNYSGTIKTVDSYEFKEKE